MTLRDEEEVLEVRDAAARCRVSVDTVRRRLRDGEFPRAQRDPGPNQPWRIPLGDLVAAGLLVPTRKTSSVPLPSTSDSLVGHIAVLEELIAVLARQVEQLKKGLSV